MKDRKDSWNPSDDSLLSKIVLEYISTGKTQLQAFEKASEMLGRTAAACGFRWNSALRHNFLTEISEAKTIRHSLKEKRYVKKGLKEEKNQLNELTFDSVLISLLNIKQEYDMLKQKLSEQDKIIKEYESKNHKPSSSELLPDDMKNFLRILGKSSIFDNLPELNDKEPAI